MVGKRERTVPRALPLVVPLVETETVNSFASRLARANGAPTARDFCRDMALSWTDLNRGDTDAIAILAELGDVPRSKLLRFAIKQHKRGSYSIGDIDLSVRGVNRTKLKVCPRCTEEDRVRHGPFGPAQRAAWQIDYIRTCERHRCLLVRLPPDGYPTERYDFASQISAASDFLRGCEALPIAHRSTAEAYLTRRLNGERQSEWLDAQSYNAAAKICERIGAGLLGKGRNVRKLTPHEWVEAADTGFRALRHGEGSLEQALLIYLDKRNAQRLQPRLELLDFYTWLQSLKLVSEMGAIRKFFQRFIEKHFSLAEGARLFGETVVDTGLVSTNQARKIFRSEGRCSSDLLGSIPLAAKTGTARLFSIEDVRGARAKIPELLPAKFVAAQLGCQQPFLRALVERGFLKQQCGAGRHGVKCAQGEIDDFVSRISAKLKPPEECGQEYLPIGNACLRACMKKIHAIDLILDAKVGATVPDDGVFALNRMLVDATGLKAVAYSKLNPSQAEICRELYINRVTVRRLANEGYLPKSDWSSRSPFLQERNVRARDLARFRNTYISIGELCARHQRPAMWVRSQLGSPRPAPLFEGKKFSKIFRRSALPENFQ